MKRLTLFCLAAIAALSLVSCEKEEKNDLFCNVTVVDAQDAIVGFTATLDASEVGSGAKFEILSSKMGDPQDPANKLESGVWHVSPSQTNDKEDEKPVPGKHYYTGFYSKNLTPGAKYYVRIKFTSSEGGKSVERIGPMSQFLMPNPGEPYVGTSSLGDVTSTSAKVHAIWMPNGQKIASVGYLISDDEKEINENKGTLVTLDSPETYDFEYTGLAPDKTYYTKLWCQTIMPENPTKYHIAQRFFSNKVPFTTLKEGK